MLTLLALMTANNQAQNKPENKDGNKDGNNVNRNEMSAQTCNYCGGPNGSHFDLCPNDEYHIEPITPAVNVQSPIKPVAVPPQTAPQTGATGGDIVGGVITTVSAAQVQQSPETAMMAGAATGASLGTALLPVVGTAVGAILGAMVGAATYMLKGNKNSVSIKSINGKQYVYFRHADTNVPDLYILVQGMPDLGEKRNLLDGKKAREFRARAAKFVVGSAVVEDIKNGNPFSVSRWPDVVKNQPDFMTLPRFIMHYKTGAKYEIRGEQLFTNLTDAGELLAGQSIPVQIPTKPIGENVPVATQLAGIGNEWFFWIVVGVLALIILGAIIKRK